MIALYKKAYSKIILDKSLEAKQRRINADKNPEPNQQRLNTGKNDMSKDNFDKEFDSKEKIGQQIGSSRKAKGICGLVMKQRHEL